MELDVPDLVDRYTAVWNEPDAERRRAAIAALWSADAAEVVEEHQWHGRAALEERVAEAYRTLIAGDGLTADHAGDVLAHHDLVVFTIRLLDAAGTVTWSARAVLHLGEDGLIRRDYHFTVPTASR
ncbi:hypothetical protein BIV57_12380 [Mangrovactinospora gilvigrisea]|uniref:SnoaL-like domain-containing protein n=1 Tax=Mangrovactinospora gilvigrisea TaxID=1428644 RepID=A0A1J7BF31_9ACTN|nr:hypothetical protein BIV57_12380 [Mangrovactinospora gilvigrisea]